jgi:starch-binding outer membrane protein, SusD/RagB family
MTQFAGSNTFPSGAFSIFGGMSSDELDYQGSYSAYHEINTNAITVTNGEIGNIWNSAFQYIYEANAILEGLKTSSGVSDSVKNQLTGEALFIRAFCDFYLVNYFGDIPLIISTDYTVNEKAVRTPVSTVYQQIIADLLQSQSLLTTDYSFSAGERVRPNRWVATALLARVYLYTGDWFNAETQASKIINDNLDFKLASDPLQVFEKNGTESIWQLIPVSPAYNYCVQDATWFIPSMNELPNASITTGLLNDFETGDLRKTEWVDSIVIGTSTYYFPDKYKIKGAFNSTEYYTVFRLAEQYLIRSEALAEQNKTDQATVDLNIIRSRAGLAPIPNGLSQAGCLVAIQQERRIEFFCECGNRWFDLQRTKTADTILSILKPNWKSSAILFPIPQSERQKDPNLTQNTGY